MRRRASGQGLALRLTLALALAVGSTAGMAASPPADEAGNGAPPLTIPATTSIKAAGTAPVAPLPALPPILLSSLPADELRNGQEIYRRFLAGLADPSCDAASAARWRKQFAHAPGRLAEAGNDLLPLFGYVVDALSEAGLPTEFALIPFVESGYKPAAQSAGGPAGLWQFIATTARNHNVAMRSGYDGRLSPVESTRAAVRYLKTLYGMFGGDWRLAVMAYNAGEYRLLQSLRRAGMNAANARPGALPGLAPVTYAYVDKLHALACVFEQADDREDLMRALDQPVPKLAPVPLPANAGSLEAWARDQGHDPALLRRLNPALAKGIAPAGAPVRVLAPVRSDETAAAQATAPAPSSPAGAATGIAMAAASTKPAAASAAPGKRPAHVVERGESAWGIARRYGLSAERLLNLNHLGSGSMLKPGMALQLDEDTIR